MLIKKCNNTSGASIFIALLFFLMCSLAGSIVLTAASTSAGRLVNLKKEEQSYYSLVSAARMLKQEIEGKKYSRYQIKSKSGALITEGYNGQSTNEGIQEFLNKAADEVFGSSNSSNTTPIDSWIIKVSDSSVEEVRAEVYMGSVDNKLKNISDAQKYDITIQLSQGGRSYTLTVPAVFSKHEEVIYNVDPDKEQIKEVTTVIWTEGEIRKN